MTLFVRTALILTVFLNFAFASFLYGSGFDSCTFDKIYFDCGYSVTVINQTSSGGSIKVTAPSGCKWQAINNDSLINITAGGSGNGNGTVNYSISGVIPPQGATIEIAGQTITISQATGLGGTGGGTGGGIIEVPTMSEWGLIIFMSAAGLVSMYYLRRQRRTES